VNLTVVFGVFGGGGGKYGEKKRGKEIRRAGRKRGLGHGGEVNEFKRYRWV